MKLIKCKRMPSDASRWRCFGYVCHLYKRRSRTNKHCMQKKPKKKPQIPDFLCTHKL